MKRVSMAKIRWTPRLVSRVVLGALVAVDLVAAALVFRPWEGSADSLKNRVASLTQELKQKQAGLDRLRRIVGKVRTARTDGDTFMSSYLLGRRTVSSTLLDELDQMARKAGIKQKEVTFGFSPVEGSEALSQAEITANYEGAYKDLTQFLNLLDHSPRLLIVDSLAATPQPSGPALEITIKLIAFVREVGAPAARIEQASAEAPGGTQ